MRNKLYWGLGVLIILFIAISSFVFYKQWTEIQQLKQEVAQDEKLLQESNKPIVSSDKPITKDDLPAADEGFKWVQHGDHFHQVPMDAPDEWQGGPHEPNVPVDLPVPAPKTHIGSLTYHKELLETHPVEAVRQQARELGHWSADHIPPFPPEDTEAAEFARALYIERYYRWTGQKDHPEFLKALSASQRIFYVLREQGEEKKTPWEQARYHDLMKLIWPDTTGEPLTDMRYPTTFTEGFNPLTARPLLPFELEMSNMGTTENK